MNYSVSIVAEGDAVTLDEVVELADAVATLNGVAVGQVHSRTRSDVVDAPNSDEAVDLAILSLLLRVVLDFGGQSPGRRLAKSTSLRNLTVIRLVLWLATHLKGPRTSWVDCSRKGWVTRFSAVTILRVNQTTTQSSMSDIPMIYLRNASRSDIVTHLRGQNSPGSNGIHLLRGSRWYAFSWIKLRKNSPSTSPRAIPSSMTVSEARMDRLVFGADNGTSATSTDVDAQRTGN